VVVVVVAASGQRQSGEPTLPEARGDAPAPTTTKKS